MSHKNPNKNQQHNESIPTQLTVNKFLENQQKELEIRQQELAIRQVELNNNQAYSLKALEAQKEDRRETRQVYTSVLKWKIIVSSICFTMILLFCGFAIFMGETHIITEVLKISLPAIISGMGGYYFGKNRGIESERNKDD